MGAGAITPQSLENKTLAQVLELFQCSVTPEIENLPHRLGSILVLDPAGEIDRFDEGIEVATLFEELMQHQERGCF